LTLREVRLARQATADLASALNRQADIEAENRRTEKLVSEASQRDSQLSDNLAMLQAAKKRINSFEGDLRILNAIAKPWREIVLSKDPKLQALYLRSESVALSARYAPFVSGLGLSQEQAHKLEAAEMAATERSLDIRASAQAQGLSLTDSAVATLLSQSEQELKSTVGDLLGDEGYSKLQDYQRTLPTRDFVNTLAGELAFTDSPLNAEQANQLVAELSAANSSYQNGGPAVSPRFQDYMELMATQSLAQEPVAWDSIQSQVQGHLSDSQFELLNSMMQDNSSTIQLYNMMQQASDAPLLGFVYSRKAP
jgi:hypothetical protein